MFDPALMGAEIEFSVPASADYIPERFRHEEVLPTRGRIRGTAERPRFGTCFLVEVNETHRLQYVPLTWMIVILPPATPLEEMREFELSEDRRNFIEEMLKHDSKRYGQWTEGMRDRAAFLSRRDI
jgi:hypothetical protein